jgi:hypothetical protein
MKYMANLTLELDNKAERSIEKLKEFYGVMSKADVIRKALALLQIAAEVDETKGELIARKGNRETRIIVR